MHMCIMKVRATMRTEKMRHYTTQFVDVEYNSVSEGIKLYFSSQIQCVCVREREGERYT